MSTMPAFMASRRRSLPVNSQHHYCVHDLDGCACDNGIFDHRVSTTAFSTTAFTTILFTMLIFVMATSVIVPFLVTALTLFRCLCSRWLRVLSECRYGRQRGPSDARKVI